MLASDLNNPEFVNPMNPDGLLYVEFYMHEPILKWQSELKSEEAGRRVVVKGPKQAFVRIMRPGDQTSILEVAVREEHKQRWPDKWLYFQMQEGLIDSNENVPGWRLEDWNHLTDKPDLLKDLKFMRFHTVDQLAGASDAQVQKLGIGGAGLREQAKVDLRSRINKEFNEKLAEKDKQLADMQARMEKLEAALSSKTLHLPKKDG